ncbi:MAG: GDYXXLXY domain-containing protein [Patescibacteria group bacterium]
MRFGSAFKFRTRPVDPYDAFRGRYLDISLLQEKVPVEPRLTPAEGQTVYAVLVVERDGFAHLARLVADRPRGVPFLRLRMTRPYNPRPDIAADAGIPLSTFALPFGRYYLNEGIAPAAESAYREHAEDEDSYLVVRVRGGSAVAEELYVGGRRIEEVAGR